MISKRIIVGHMCMIDQKMLVTSMQMKAHPAGLQFIALGLDPQVIRDAACEIVRYNIEVKAFEHFHAKQTHAAEPAENRGKAPGGNVPATAHAARFCSNINSFSVSENVLNVCDVR